MRRDKLRLRQIAFVAENLAKASDDMCAILGIEVGYRDPGVGKWGLENVVCPLGGSFFEIVAPKQPNTSAGRYLQRRKGDGGYMVILQGADAVADRQRIQAMGIRAVATADREHYLYTHFHPSDLGGFLLSMDSTLPKGDYMERYAPWEPAGPDWKAHRREDTVKDIVGVELQSDDPKALAALWSKVLDLPAAPAGANWKIELADAKLTFVTATDGRGPGIGAIDLAAPGKARALAEAEKRGLKAGANTVLISGCRVNLL